MYTGILYKTDQGQPAVAAFKHGFDTRPDAIAWARARANALGIPRDPGTIVTEAFAAFLARTGYQLLPGAEDSASVIENK
jgi:hypothetical protein